MRHEFFSLKLLIRLFYPIFETYNSTLNTQINLTYHASFAKNIVEKKLAEEKTTFQEFNKLYAPKSDSLAKTLIVTNVFFIALALQLLFFKKKKYFADNLFFAFEYYSFNLFVNHFILPILVVVIIIFMRMLDVNIQPYLNDGLFGALLLATSFYFFIKGIKKYYEVKNIYVFVSAALMLGVLIVAIDFYRLVLFLVTMWTI